MSGEEILGARARQILEDELFISAFEAVERAAIEEMLNVKWWQVRRLLDHAARIRAIRDARTAIEAVMLRGLEAARTRESTSYIV